VNASRKSLSYDLLRHSGKFVLKDIIDLAGAFFFLLLLLPLFVVIAVLIKAESRGPVFYKASRIGKDEQYFLMYKFRTMIHDADKIGPALTEQGDSRITKVGKVLRRSSLDELPQLINVIKGEMSFIGPRPEIPEIIKTYSDEQKKALRVKPGLTGLSQVNGRDDLPLNRKLEYEISYVENHSFLLDLKILLKTIPALLNGRGNRC
jgi:lipopolysaccharide/colanic/teichoic acid biosynthesis glycosyltransferase